MELRDPSIEGSRNSRPWEEAMSRVQALPERESLSSSLGWGVSRKGVGGVGVRGVWVCHPHWEPKSRPPCSAGHLQCERALLSCRVLIY